MKPDTGFDKPNITFTCPSGSSGSLPNSTCTLLDVCQWNGFISGQPDQWFRFIIPIFLHGGVVHILFNLAFQVQNGFDLEKDMGWWRMAIVYFASGVGGFIFGASLSDVRTPSVGASGSLYGTRLWILHQYWILSPHLWLRVASF
jgi:membrane associated rhomboid family serine protease